MTVERAGGYSVCAQGRFNRLETIRSRSYINYSTLPRSDRTREICIILSGDSCMYKSFLQLSKGCIQSAAGKTRGLVGVVGSVGDAWPPPRLIQYTYLLYAPSRLRPHSRLFTRPATFSYNSPSSFPVAILVIFGIWSSPTPYSAMVVAKPRSLTKPSIASATFIAS